MGFRWAVKMQAHLNFRPITTLHCFPPPSIRPPTRRQLMLPVLSAVLRRAPTPFSLLPLALAPPPPPPPTLLRRRPLLLPRAISSSTSPPPVQEMEAAYKFGPYKIDAREVFHSTPLSYAMVNLRPLLPVCPKREVKRFADLSSNEISDLWVTAKEVGIRLEQYHKASSLTFAIQIDVKERELKEKLDLDIERKDRTMEEMAHEANEYRGPPADTVHDNDHSHDDRDIDACPDDEGEHVVAEADRSGHHAGVLPRDPRRLLAVAATDLAAPHGEAAVDSEAGAGRSIRAELFLMEKTCCCDTEGELVLSKPSSSCAL
uniref:Uncharacterized protein n=1 Tax=Oryza glumipatula TaxID=40148 RepID=A0A0E0BEP3_9ORYZ